jgi:hypothetical protein
MPPAKGRSKKSAAAAADAATATAAEVPPVPASAPVAAAPPAKKSKKAVKVVAVVTPDGIEGSFVPEPRRPLIAHLGIKTNEVVFYDQPLQYNPNPPTQPEPYDPTQCDMFSSGQEEVDTVQKEAVEVSSVTTPAPVAPTVVAAPETKAVPCFTKLELMVQYKSTKDAKRLPDTTDIACFWCAHSFSGQPAIIPEREVGGVYNVYGNFCSPECAMAYLLTESLDPHVRWERMSLLHRIYDPSGRSRVFPAPARECLSLFGGPMSIESFRATLRERKVRVDMHMPPMVSILGSIDTKPIDFFDTTLRGGAVAPSTEKVQKAEEGLRLRRTKPLKDKESTLDSLMNIQVNAGRRGGGAGLALGTA